MKTSGETKLFGSILLVAVLLVAVAVYPMLSGKKTTVAPPPHLDLKTEDLIQRDTRFRGDVKAPYTLVEFGDYQCPMCMSSEEQLPGILAKHAAKLRYVFHYYQPTPAHVHTRLMARAAEAAANQGKYWEMHAALFKAQPDIEEANNATADKVVHKVARNVGLDMLRFEGELKDKTTEDRVQASQDHTAKLGIHSTPTFVIIPPGGKPQVIGALGDLTVWLKDPKHLQ